MQDESPNEHAQETSPTVHQTLDDGTRGLQKLMDEQGHLVLWSRSQFVIGDVIRGITISDPPVADFHPEIKVVVVGTATKEEYLAQERRRSNKLDRLYHLVPARFFCKVIAE